MSTHEGVSCDNCLKSNFGGIRYKCLICYDFDLCETCHPFDSTTSPHLASHPMQSILTQADFGLYYSGESITPDNPPAFVCPYCGKLGFTEALLQEHVLKEHANDRTEVVCPICAALPSGEPNLVSDDFGGHLQNEHRGQRDIDDPSSGRQMRRRGMRSRNHRTMHFSGGPLASSNTGATSAISSNNNSATSVASAARDMDPIAELLSQLSGVRRNAQILQQVVSSETHINEIQSKLQMERQRAAEIRQQLQRFPIKTQSQNGDVQSSAGVAQNGMSSNNSKSGNSVNKRATVHSPDEDSKRFLLNNLDELNTGDTENQCGTPEKALFVQELLLSLLSSPPQVTPVDTQHQDDTESSSFSSKSMKESEQSVSKQACGSVEQQVAGGRKTTEKKSKAAESKKKSTRRKEAPKSATSPMPMSNGTTLTKEQTDISPSSPSPSSRQKSTAAASAAVMPSSSPVEKEVGNSAASVVDEPPRNIDDDRPPSPSARSPAHHGGSARLYLGGGTTTTASSGPVRIDHRCASAASAAAEYNSGNTSDQVSTGAAMKNNLR